jgi:hypothetical protein
LIRSIDWGSGRTLHGNGPGYLLLSPGQALDLRTGAPEIVDPGLRDRLHGFSALPSDSPIYQAAAHLAHLARMHGVLWDQEKERERQVSVGVLINLLTRAVLDPEHKLDRHIGELSTILKVAWELMRHTYLAKQLQWRFDKGKFWWLDENGAPLEVTDCDYGVSDDGVGSLLTFHRTKYEKLRRLYGDALTRTRLWENLKPVTFAVRTSRTSYVARCAENLGKVPTKADLRQSMRASSWSVRYWCATNGFGWLPKSGRDFALFSL